MRITFLLPEVSLAGGVRVVAVYSQRLMRRGHRVTVVALPPWRPSLRDRLRSLRHGRGWPAVQKNPPTHFDGTAVDLRVLESRRPVTAADVPDADVIIATWWETAEWVARLPHSKGAKAYFIQGHEIFPWLPADRVKATYSLPMHKITISRWLADMMRNEYGDPDVSMVLNGVDLRQFTAPVRDKHAVPTVGMLYAGSRVKGCDVSLAAVALARERLPGLRLVAFGAEHPRPDLPLPPGTVYSRQPAQDSIKAIYSQCDVWLCGSRSEGFHLPLLEAMACRCPVVSTRVGGPMDVIRDGLNGYLADVEDVAALADRLVRVLTLPPGEWRKMSDAAYATAQGSDWDAATDLFEAALITAMDRSRRRGRQVDDFTAAGITG